jgi:putative ABC transport system permease protein
MLTNYIKIAWKVLLRHPFYTFITLFGISLTLTALMVLTSFLDQLLGNHYPETKRNRSLYVWQLGLRDSTGNSGNQSDMSFKFVKSFVLPLKTPEKIAIISSGSTTNSYVGSKRIKVEVKFSDAAFWDVTDFSFVAGKPYTAQNVINADNVAVISDSFQSAYFSGNESVIGKTIEVDNTRYRVIGVVKGVPTTRMFTAADVYLPYTVPKSNHITAGYLGMFRAIVLARNESDRAAIKAEYDAVIKRIPVPFTDNGFKTYIVRSSANTYLDLFASTQAGGPDTSTFTTLLILFALLFMMLPALNLINLNVGRSMERASEIGIRKAFGAPTQTLLGQFVIENIFITLIGGLIALGLSSVIILLINQSGWVAHLDMTINPTVLAVSILLCLLFGVMSGVIPAWRMAKLSVVNALKTN